MSPNATRYSLIVAVTATAAAGVFYTIAKSRFNALRDLGEGTAEEIQSTVRALDISFLLLVVTSIVTMTLLPLFLAQRQKGESHSSQDKAPS